MVPWLAKASIAVGADGLMVEVHHKPQEALSDGAQSLNTCHFDQLMHELQPIARAVGASLPAPVPVAFQ
jgi:3-deoxy-7-phosphoheptulonate synthase